RSAIGYVAPDIRAAPHHVAWTEPPGGRLAARQRHTADAGNHLFHPGRGASAGRRFRCLWIVAAFLHGLAVVQGYSRPRSPVQRSGSCELRKATAELDGLPVCLSAAGPRGRAPVGFLVRWRVRRDEEI